MKRGGGAFGCDRCTVATVATGQVWSALVRKQRVAVKAPRHGPHGDGGDGSRQASGAASSRAVTAVRGAMCPEGRFGVGGLAKSLRRAVKYRLFEAGARVSAELMDEIQQLASCRHENVVAFVGW